MTTNLNTLTHFNNALKNTLIGNVILVKKNINEAFITSIFLFSNN